jgi:intracellular septation protein
MTDLTNKPVEKSIEPSAATSSTEEQQGMSSKQWVRMGLELGPLIIFFLMNSKAHAFFGSLPEDNIFYATGCFMVAIAISLIATYALHRTIPIMPLVTGGFVLVFGGLTIFLQDEQFIKLKPTITNLIFASGLLGGLALGKPTMKYLFDSAFQLDDMGWRKLTLRWGLFFVFLAIVNEIVWRNFSTDFWVSFKVFGLMPITAVFAMFQVRVVTEHQLVKPEDESTA